MAATRYKQDLNLLGSLIQVFTDLTPSTVKKHCSLKPLLQQLQNCQIKYRWSFPFCFSFTYRGRNHSFSNYHDGEGLLLELGIISRDHSPTPPTNYQNRALSPIWSSQWPRKNGRTLHQLEQNSLSPNNGTRSTHGVSFPFTHNGSKVFFKTS